MSSLSPDDPKGCLRAGWYSTVGDYAIACGWACGGDLLVVGDAAGGVSAFEGNSGALRWSSAEIHKGGLLAMAVSPDGNLVATTGQDGRVLLWAAEDGERRREIDLGKGWVEHVAWSSDGTKLATSISRKVYVFDQEGLPLWNSEDHPSTVSALAWVKSDEVATACYGRASFFSASSGELLQKLEWKGSLVSMVLSPDGNVVVCGSQDNSVHFWRRSTGLDSQMSGYRGKPSALAFDSKGTLLATGGGESVTVWSFLGDGPEGTSPGVLNLHVLPITKLAFAPRGRRLASGARDGGVIIWELEKDGAGTATGAAILEELVSGLSWRPDGRALAGLDASGQVSVWRVGSR